VGLLGNSGSNDVPRLADRRKGDAVSPLIDAFLETYVVWRERCEEVKSAYERWATSHHGERFLAFAAYREALDREELAAHMHHNCVERLRPAEASARAA
jgi:hypothetical protein